MAKYLNKNNYSKVAYGTEGYTDLSGFEEVTAEAGSKGEIGVIRIDDCVRIRLSKNLFSQLEMPDCVKVLLGDKKLQSGPYLPVHRGLMNSAKVQLFILHLSERR